MIILPILTSIPRPVLALLALALYGAAVRWRPSWPALIDIALLGLLIYRPSLGLAAWVACLMIVRHTPALSADVVALLGLEQFDGWTARAILFALPALRSLMSNADEGSPEAVRGVVHVPVLGTALVSGESPAVRDIRDDWIVRMAEARDEKGKFLYSANDIFKANGGHRATVMARVKEVQTGVPPAAFRRSDGTTAPAEYPVTSQKAAP